MHLAAENTAKKFSIYLHIELQNFLVFIRLFRDAVIVFCRRTVLRHNDHIVKYWVHQF